MGQGILVDTNAIIYYLGNQLPEKAVSKFEQYFKDDRLFISIINKIEALSYPKHSSKTEGLFREFIEKTTVINLDKELAEAVIKIRKNYNIKLPDAIIAASSLNNDHVLVTSNIKDFKKIKGLKVVDPMAW